MTKENTARNARIKAERHAKRMFAQRNKTHTETIDGFAVLNVVPMVASDYLFRAILQTIAGGVCKAHGCARCGIIEHRLMQCDTFGQLDYFQKTGGFVEDQLQWTREQLGVKP